MLPFLPPGGDQGRQEGSDATRTHPCSHYNAIGIRTSQNTKGEPITLETIQAAPTAHTRGTIHRRLQPLYTQTKKRFPAPAPSPKKAPCTSHAATTMRFAATRTHPCSHYNAICIHVLQNTKGEPIQRWKTIAAATAAHTRYTLHRRLQPLYAEKHKVLCSGILLKTNPMQQSCSHYNPFCSNTYPSMQPLQCDLHSHVAEHQGRTDFARNDPNRTRRTHEVPFIATCSHFTRKNAWFRAPASSPTQAPFNIRSATMWCKVGYKVSHHPSRMLCSVM